MISHSQLARTARDAGEVQMNLSFNAANAVDPTFGERAYTFIVDYIRAQTALYGSVPGEQATLAAQAAGIGAGRDARAFGAIFAKAIRQGDIKVVGSCPRVRGHGTAGGRLYSAGST